MRMEMHLAHLVACQNAQAGKWLVRDDQMRLAAQALLNNLFLGFQRDQRQIVYRWNPGKALQVDAVHYRVAAEEGCALASGWTGLNPDALVRGGMPRRQHDAHVRRQAQIALNQLQD